MKETPRELNTKAYAMTIKEKEVLNQWLDEQLKVGLIKESKSRQVKICSSLFLHSKEGWIIVTGARLLEIKSNHYQR